MEPAQTPRSRFGSRIFRPPRVHPLRIRLPPPPRVRTGGASFTTVIAGFALVIFLGAFLLTLPIASHARAFTSPVDALFTATSAVCVTGLAVVDTGTYWSSFGQGVILALMQFGGFGFMVSATLFLLALRRRVGLRERLLTTQSLGLESFGGFLGLVRRMAAFSLGAELLGGFILFAGFLPYFPVTDAIWRSVFQAVSAFNNCGYDILGQFQSLIPYRTSPLLILTTAALIILGGLSYVTIADWARKRRFSLLTADSKIVLSLTAVLLLGGTVFYLVAEWGNPATLGPLSLPGKLMVSFFQAVVPRTAGFTAVNTGAMLQVSLFFTILLMFIGGASGSTAGGVKVGTFGILFFTAVSTLRGREQPVVFGRSLLPEQVQRALTLSLVYLLIALVVAIAITAIESVSFDRVLFESFSALGTVGLSTGITPSLTPESRLILTLTMFIGRVGPLSLISVLVERQRPSVCEYPRALIRIG